MYNLHALINTFSSTVESLNDNRTTLPITINNKTRCATLSMTWSRLNTTSLNCNNYPYMGTKCKEFLTTWLLCTIGDGDIYVNETEHTQSQQEENLALLDTVLG